MLLIDEEMFQSFLELEMKEHFIDYLNKLQFKVKNSAFSHRQINTLDNDGLLDDSRESDKEWRKFNFIDLVYLQILSSLKKYGIMHEALKLFRNSFFEKLKFSLKEKKYDMTVSEIIIGCAFTGVEILICFNTEGKTIFFDPKHFIAKRHLYLDDFIFLSLSSLIDEVRKNLNSDPIALRYRLIDILLQRSDLSDREKEIISILRNNGYESIDIQKKSECWSYKATKVEVEKVLKISDLQKIIEENPYLGIELKIGEGQILHYRLIKKARLPN